MSSCFKPIEAWRDVATGEFKFFRDARREQDGPIDRPCGQCGGCRLDKAREWSVRIACEALTTPGGGCFLTLTFDDEHFPSSEAEAMRCLDKMLKRMRKAHPGVVIKTFGCFELGDVGGRPHFHLIVLGLDFERGRRIGGSEGAELYQSPELDRLWPYGMSSVGALTAESAKYVAGYVLKKRSTRDSAGQTVAVAHPLTGELVHFSPARSVAISRGRAPRVAEGAPKPPKAERVGFGLGGPWFRRFGEQALRQGFVMAEGGQRSLIPAYFLKLAKLWFPEAAENYAAELVRRAGSPEAIAERAPERIEARAEVFRARTRFVRAGSL